MTTLWNTSGKKVDKTVQAYTVGTDYVFDMHLLPFDIDGSVAHARGLQKIGILTAKELKDVLRAFAELRKDFTLGRITITPEDEDCHTVIEHYLVEKLGDVGKKIHTGRSRNDQVLTAVRLYMKHHVALVRTKCLDLADSCVEKADAYQHIPMPGYSHTQQAMLSSVGHYMASIAESLLDDESFLASVADHIDKSPLGSAAGFGSAIPLDRAYTARELGFAAVQINSLYCQTSRGKFESAVMEGLSQVSATLARLANDLVWFTSQEFAFFDADDAVVTGSSIMPQKRNLDPLELLRGNAAIIAGNQLAIKELSKNLLSGYNRDLQLMKKPLMESMMSVEDGLEIARVVLQHVQPNEKEIRARIHPGMFLADIANDMVLSRGVPFRDAYALAKGMEAKDMDLAKNIREKRSLGAPGKLGLATYRARIARARRSMYGRHRFAKTSSNMS